MQQKGFSNILHCICCTCRLSHRCWRCNIQAQMMYPRCHIWALVSVECLFEKCWEDQQHEDRFAEKIKQCSMGGGCHRWTRVSGFLPFDVCIHGKILQAHRTCLSSICFVFQILFMLMNVWCTTEQNMAQTSFQKFRKLMLVQDVLFPYCIDDRNIQDTVFVLA